MPEPSPNSELIRLVVGLRDRYATYHTQKETMAYAGFALYVTAFAAGILSPKWPPDWDPNSPVTRFLLSAGVATAAWFAALWFVGWQLLRRRVAAIRVAGSERLLTKWLTEPPTDAHLQPWHTDRPLESPRSLKLRCQHFLWPASAPIPEGDVKDEAFPSVIVVAWKAQDSWPGTQAMQHEAALLRIGWGLWFAVLAKAAVVVFL